MTLHYILKCAVTTLLKAFSVLQLCNSCKEIIVLGEMKSLSVSFTAKCKKLTILLDIKSGMLLVPIPAVKVQFSFAFSRNRDLFKF